MTFSRSLSCCMVFLLFISSRLDSVESRPNIIVIITDDQGYGDLGITGNPVLETPHIDQLARESASVERFYVNPVCAPTRAALMTGRYNFRTRAIDTWVGRAMMDTEEITLAEVLHKDGYATGIFGKWHLGDCYPLRPIDQGFDESLIHLGGGLAQPSEPKENERRYTDAILFKNGKPVKTKGYCTDVYFDASIEFIKKSQKDKKPFFIFLPTNAPHGPFHDVPEKLYQKYKSKDLAPLKANPRHYENIVRVFAMVENIDENVGKVTQHLKATGLDKKTIVIYLHDNGPQMARFVGPMVGTKTQVHEGGIRSPFYVRWPQRLQAGTVVKKIGAHIDIMPTLIEAAGLEMPKGVKIDGRSLLPYLEGRNPAWKDRTIFIQSHRGDRPILYHHIAVIGPRWKLRRATGFGKQQPSPDVPFELFDLINDPKEQKNLVEQHPQITNDLKAQYVAWFKDVGSTRPNNYDPPRIVVGNDKETVTYLTQQDWRRLAGRGWGTQGEWWLRFEGTRSFRVRVLAKSKIHAGPVHLEIGKEKFTVDNPALADEVVFKKITIGPGDKNLKVVFTASDKPTIPYHVFLERLDR